MKHRLLLIAFVALGLVACQNETAPTNPTPPPAAPVPLKDITISSLPSPYFHFDYDSAGRPTFVSYASSLLAYDIGYDSARISELRSTAGNRGDRLAYTYDADGRVAAVQEKDSTGVVITFVSFTYDGARLVQLERDLRVTGGFLVIQTMTFAYNGDNVSQITDHRPASAGQPETVNVQRYEDYDDGINVDGFTLLHTGFFDHVILLPDVKLQQGNPRRLTGTGDGTNYTVDYTYTYDGLHRPLTKQGDILIQNGPLAGNHYATSSVFSYY